MSDPTPFSGSTAFVGPLAHDGGRKENGHSAAPKHTPDQIVRKLREAVHAPPSLPPAVVDGRHNAPELMEIPISLGIFEAGH
jgi:hypothetical protein